MFTEVVGSSIVLTSKGMYRQAVLYKRSDSLRVYAKVGNAFIRIGSGDATSCPTYAWEDLQCEFVVPGNLHAYPAFAAAFRSHLKAA